MYFSLWNLYQLNLNFAFGGVMQTFASVVSGNFFVAEVRHSPQFFLKVRPSTSGGRANAFCLSDFGTKGYYFRDDIPVLREIPASQVISQLSLLDEEDGILVKDLPHAKGLIPNADFGDRSPSEIEALFSGAQGRSRVP